MNRGHDLSHAMPEQHALGPHSPAAGNAGQSPQAHAQWQQPYKPPQQGPFLSLQRTESTTPLDQNTQNMQNSQLRPGQYPHYNLPQAFAPRHSTYQPQQHMSVQGESMTLPQLNIHGKAPLPGFSGSVPGASLAGMSKKESSPRIPAFTHDSSPSTAAGPSGPPMPDKLRVRVVKACERCRSHKIKCTGLHPCGNCSKHGIQCRFRSSVSNEEPPTRSQSVEAPTNFHTPLSDASDVPGINSGESKERTTDSAGPEKRDASKRMLQGSGSDYSYKRGQKQHHPPNQNQANDKYTQYLEDRVRYLESVVAKTSTQSSSGSVDPTAYRLEDVVDIQQPYSVKWRLCRRYQSVLSIELCASLYKGLSPEAQAQVTVPRMNYFAFNMSGCSFLKPEKLPAPPDVSIVTTEQRQALIDYFFAEINPLFAILHEKVFREQYRAFADSFAQEHETNNMALYSAMLSLVLALSLRFTEFAKPAGPAPAMIGVEQCLYSYAHKILSIFSLEWESFELIQCWLLAALYLRITHRQTSAHSTLAQAVSMMRSMGLGTYDQIPHVCSSYERSKAKRIFFATYTFDRIIGLQGGKFAAIGDEEIRRAFPSRDYDAECGKDDWITRPAFAMLQIAQLANYLSITHSTDRDLILANKINRDFSELLAWLNANGFDDQTDIFEHECGMSSLVRAQVKFHFYELVHCVYGRSLFSFLGRRVQIEGLRTDTLLQCNKDTMFLLEKVAAAGKLYTPWYLTLQLVHTVGVNCLVFINAGHYLAESRQLIKQTMVMLQKLRDAPVQDESGNTILPSRFKMADECQWLFKLISHIMSLHYEESLKGLAEIGTDHGSSEVNKGSLRFEEVGIKPAAHLATLMNNEGDVKRQTPNGWYGTTASNAPEKNLLSDSHMQLASSQYGIDRYLDSLAWFDQWLDFNHEM